MAAKKSSPKSTKFSFSWAKLTFSLSVAFSLASIVFLVTLFKTTYFDSAMMSMLFERNLDSNGCYIGPDKGAATNQMCLIGVGVDKDGKIAGPEWLKGQTYPKSN